ncbi:MAG: cysteine desulfurase [Oscillospiraceae bacterium]|nr:cysteine desulfurase [Oscillospiraceae bacterium]
MNVYFDNAASTRVRDEAIEIMQSVMRENYGNPSSMHAFGRSAKNYLETARKNLSDSIKTKPENIYFTSGGTEANNWAIQGAASKLDRKGRHIITSAIEHSAVLDPIKKLESQGWEVTYLSPGPSGSVPVKAFTDALRDDTVFASVMLVNNETGAINPVNEYSNTIKQKGLKTILHTDAIQALCKIPFTVNSLGADLITLSSHKLHGPKGAGALFIGNSIKLTPLILGGNHEKGNRGGTEAFPAIVGFGEAVKLGVSEFDSTFAYIEDLHKYTINLLEKEIPEAIILLANESSENITPESKEQTLFKTHYSPFILPISLPGYKSEVLMNYLDGEGICVSRSAACKKGARSRTLEAMKLSNNIIDGALRVSFSRYSTKEEADYFVKILKAASKSLQKTR